MKKQSFVKGALILMIFGLLSKVLGAIYRIPLTSIITPEGMGLYQMVFPVYSLLLTLSSSGLPSSIAKLISERIAKHEYRQADRILKVSFCLLFAFSLLCSLVLVFGAKLFASFQGNSEATLCYLGLAPAILFVGLISGFRGYFQGLQKMSPSAISGFVEQLFKLGFGLFLAASLMRKGISYAVFGAMLGISISEAVSALYLFINFLVFKARHREEFLKGEELVLTRSKTAKSILSTSVFVTLGGLIMPLSMVIDSALIINILKKSMSTKLATSLFGLESGTVGSIVNMPVVLSLSLATAILPCVSFKRANGDEEGAKRAASKALFLAIVIALPAAIGCYCLALPIIKLLYGHSLTTINITIAANILEVAAASVFYLALVQVTAGILQGMGLMFVPAISLLAGVVVKIVLNVTLVAIPSIGIYGAEVSNAACYFVALIINLLVIMKKGAVKFSPKIVLVLLSSLIVFIAKPVYNLLFNAGLNFYLALITCVFAAVILYFILIFLIFKRDLKAKV